jgi:hypothetical protein
MSDGVRGIGVQAPGPSVSSRSVEALDQGQKRETSRHRIVWQILSGNASGGRSQIFGALSQDRQRALLQMLVRQSRQWWGLVVAIGVLRALSFIALALTLCGCGLARQRELQERNAALQEQSKAAMQECDAKFPKGVVATVVPRIQCLNDAMAIVRPTSRNPDLLESFMASRSAIAERIQKGQITMAQGNEEIANKWSQVVAEDQRRALANRSVSAQETAAQNIGGPTSCTRVGNTVNCF